MNTLKTELEQYHYPEINEISLNAIENGQVPLTKQAHDEYLLYKETRPDPENVSTRESLLTVA